MRPPSIWLQLFMLLTTAHVVSALTLNNVPRRAFVTRSVASLLSTVVVLQPSERAQALDDLAMPSAQEAKELDEEAIMAARIRRKLELQKEKSAPKTFAESFESERIKQKELKSQTKEERRNALCEELGRGC